MSISHFIGYTGVPTATDATQFDCVETVGDAGYAVYNVLCHLKYDDTTVRILSLVKENNASKEVERTGMYTTGILSEYAGHTIYLFISGRQHAGENVSDILRKRDLRLPPILTMCDGLSANTPKNLPAELKIIILNCLAHARRKFYEIHTAFPEECQVVIDALAQVYKHDADCKKAKFDEDTQLDLPPIT